MKYLLDTNVISELIAKKPNSNVIRWIDDIDPNQLYLSVITLGEIQKGISKLKSSKRKTQLQTWLNDDLLLRFQNNIAELTIDVMLTWGKLTGELASQGKTISAIDSLIAAIVIEGSFVLVTRNESDFSQTKIPMVNPWALSK